MTQSGQGDEQQLPAVRPAHEGVVLPAGGGEPWIPGGQAGQAVPAGGEPWGRPWGAQAPHGQYDQQGQYGQGPVAYGHEPQPQPYAQPLPPEAVPGAGMGADADATQYIAPVPAGPAPGGLPPEGPAEATQFLAHAQPPAAASDADATQYIPPVPGGTPYGIRPGTPGERQPPAEFDNLFRSEEPAGATQQMPRFDPGPAAPYQAGRQQPPYQQPQMQQQHSDPPQGRAGQRKKPSHIPLIAAVVVGCAIVGLGAGALMSGGDDKKDDKQAVAASSSPAAKPSGQAAADPAKPQAEELDKLLADSNNSRSAVIGAVEKTKSCKDLDQAVADLQGAARQRRELVTRLQGLSVDKLPNHAQLTAALTKAWQASASADDHYAAWAGQAKDGKKVCRHGKARATPEKSQADRASGDASMAKQQASGLWNAIASKYGLTRRTATEL
ncbi:hypothetical protein [Streptomyces sp. NBC_00316]|uniref:hypothetical protein n=1 Tax=Streptomyces sp. NBC_00316 TaxID=2975710 RepID=UPI002E2DE682|nr:hypothetical protein [Streptomyces sp. NBC_00316]